MCGIAGYFLNTPRKGSIDQLEGMLSAIRKRGPDDEGICLISLANQEHCFYKGPQTHPAFGSWPELGQAKDREHDIALLHSRYAILDLSEKGHQPFISQDGQIIAVFNGEIYNYLELRAELSVLGVQFKSQCDTEVLVEGYRRWKQDLWPRLNGFWAVVLYDKQNQNIVLSRDRMGVAPLYYRQTTQGLFFSSYIDPLVHLDSQKASLNQEAVMGFLQAGFKDVNLETFYQEIKTIPSATAIVLKNASRDISQAEHQRFWHLPSVAFKEKDISFSEAVSKLRSILFDAVTIRLRSDVKLAFELSGGLDSSSVVAVAANVSKSKISTFTAKINHANEEPYARFMTKRYALDYHVISDVEDSFSRDYGYFSKLMEEPFDNPNAYTHYQMLLRMKQQGVKVVITGAGGDEALAGYESSFWPRAYYEWERQGFIGLFRSDWYEFCRRFRTRQNALKTLGHYLSGPFRWALPRPKAGKTESISPAMKLYQHYPKLSFHQQRCFHFTTALLPFYMRSSDHFTMGIPIEHRFPLLDYRLVELGLQLPISYLFRNGWTKYILRKAMEPYLPKEILWRRQKMGFQFPFGQYLLFHRSVFEPVLKGYDTTLDYGQLLQKDPVGLWRLLSVAIWMKNL